MFCEIYLQSAVHTTTIHDLFIYLFIYLFILFSSFFFLTDSRSPILHHRSFILDPDFPVNLEVCLLRLFLFSTAEVITCSKVVNAFKR